MSRRRTATWALTAGTAAAGELVEVAIDGATSTTLRGSQLTAVAA